MFLGMEPQPPTMCAPLLSFPLNTDSEALAEVHLRSLKCQLRSLLLECDTDARRWGQGIRTFINIPTEFTAHRAETTLKEQTHYILIVFHNGQRYMCVWFFFKKCFLDWRDGYRLRTFTDLAKTWSLISSIIQLQRIQSYLLLTSVTATCRQ